MSTLFRRGRMFDGVCEALLDGVEVLVAGDRIVEVSDVPIRSGTAEVVDLRDRTLMPGLIDAHFHAIAASPDLAAVERMPASPLAHVLADSVLQRARVLAEAAFHGPHVVPNASLHGVRGREQPAAESEDRHRERRHRDPLRCPSATLCAATVRHGRFPFDSTPSTRPAA